MGSGLDAFLGGVGQGFQKSSPDIADLIFESAKKRQSQKAVTDAYAKYKSGNFSTADYDDDVLTSVKKRVGLEKALATGFFPKDQEPFKFQGGFGGEKSYGLRNSGSGVEFSDGNESMGDVVSDPQTPDQRIAAAAGQNEPVNQYPSKDDIANELDILSQFGVGTAKDRVAKALQAPTDEQGVAPIVEQEAAKAGQVQQPEADPYAQRIKDAIASGIPVEKVKADLLQRGIDPKAYGL